MKLSLITTVLNEENSIIDFLNSVKNQTRLPDELIIVDGGSTDNTVSLVKNFLSKNKVIPIKTIEKKGNRSIGRNTAIKNSTGDIIADSDAGCILDKNWLMNLINPFKNNGVDVSAGFYRPRTNSIFEKSLSTYTCVMPDKVDPQKFLPSSRSIAFRKSAWEKVHGYPEELDTCEDLVFAKKLKHAGLKFHFVKNAIVYWPQRKNIFQAGKQFFNYAVGDGQALYIRPQTPFLFARYILGAVLVITYFITKSTLLLFSICFLVVLYLVWAIWKNYKYVKHPKAFLYLPLLQILSDLSVIAGMGIGFLKRFSRQY